jgi:uracil-DNA glycosylase
MTLEENMGKDWYQLLSPYIKSDKFKDLAFFIQQEYKTKKVCPTSDNVFKAFRLTPFNDVRVVIVGEEPQNKLNQSTGLSYGVNPGAYYIPSDLEDIVSELETSYDKGILLNFDYTLESWAKQGVLMLNTALTVLKDKKNSHKEQWKDFTREVFRLLKENHTGLIFVFVGDEFENYQVGNHNVIWVNSFKSSMIFKDIDNMLKGINGNNNLIKWNETI